MSDLPEPTFTTPSTQLTEEELIDYQQKLTDWEKDLNTYAADLDNHAKSRERALDNRKNAEIEYDKLIVYLAGGGLVLTVGFVKDITKATKTTDVGWLLGCWICFALALLLNLISHALTRMAADALLTDAPNWKKLDKKVNWANWICLILVGLGIFVFLVFVFLNFQLMSKSPANSGPMQIILPAGTGQTNGQVLGPSASGRPTPPTPPALPKITSK